MHRGARHRAARGDDARRRGGGRVADLLRPAAGCWRAWACARWRSRPVPTRPVRRGLRGRRDARAPAQGGGRRAQPAEPARRGDAGRCQAGAAGGLRGPRSRPHRGRHLRAAVRHAAARDQVLGHDGAGDLLLVAAQDAGARHARGLDRGGALARRAWRSSSTRRAGPTRCWVRPSWRSSWPAARSSATCERCGRSSPRSASRWWRRCPTNCRPAPGSACRQAARACGSNCPRGCPRLRCSTPALEKGIRLGPGLMYSNSERFDNFIRINAGNPMDDAQRRAIATLGEALHVDVESALNARIQGAPAMRRDYTARPPNSCIAFIGGGNMASAIVGGLRRAGFRRRICWWSSPSRRSASVSSPTSASGRSPRRRPRCRGPAPWSGRSSPQLFQEAAVPVAPHVAGALQLSVMAGLRSDAIARATGAARVVRGMPNTPALIGQGITGLCASAAVTADDRALVEQLLQPTGRTVWVDNEGDLDTVTALSGSGPAYFFFLVEHMVAAARAGPGRGQGARACVGHLRRRRGAGAAVGRLADRAAGEGDIEGRHHARRDHQPAGRRRRRGGRARREGRAPPRGRAGRRVRPRLMRAASRSSAGVPPTS